LSDIQRLLEANPTSPDLPRLAHALAARLEQLEVEIDEAFIPFSLLTHAQYQARRDHLDQVKRHLHAHGIGVMPVRSVTGQDVVLYVHRQHAPAGAEVAS
jgi:hypothetical protein